MDDVLNPRQPDAPAASRPRRRWFRRLLYFLLLIVVGGAGVFAVIVYRVRSSPPFVTALKLIQEDPQLNEYLGGPLRETRLLPSGPYPEQFNLQVKGPNGVADVSIRARQLEGKWVLSAVDAVILNGGKRLSLDTSAGGGPGDAPTWSPSGGGATAGDDAGLEPPPGVKVEQPEGPPGVSIELPESPPDLDIQMPSIPSPPKL